MKPTKEFIPMDEYERELWEYENDENYNPESIPNLEEEKNRLQKIAQYSIEKKELLKEIAKDKELDNLIITLKNDGISIADFLHNVFYKLANGAVDKKQFQH